MKHMVFSQLITGAGGIAIGALVLAYLINIGQIDIPRPNNTTLYKDQSQASRIYCAAGSLEVMGADGNIVSCEDRG